MFLNKLVPESVSSKLQNASPDYAELIRFLLQPFLDSPESLSVDCELSHAQSRVWIRLAFEAADKGRVFGRGGRNIQAIRTVMEAVAQAIGQTIYLDIFGSGSTSRETPSEGRPSEGRSPARSAPPRRHPAPKPR
jgi:predicted RNA-binding protein YlqC (UPF0109 family)